ncbi:MAG: hypothetical protein ACJAT4_001151 [Granulosicoccus sp.]|jgi:hypothetical protein
MENSEKYYKAQQRVKQKKGFYIHLLIYMIVNLVFLFISYMDGQGFQWLYICLFWAIGLIPHYFGVFGFPGKQKLGSKEWEEREIQKELDKMEDNQYPLGSEDDLELRELNKLPREWDDKDLV